MRGALQESQAPPVSQHGERQTSFLFLYASSGLGASQCLFLNAISPRQHDKLSMSSRYRGDMLPGDGVMKHFEIRRQACCALSSPSVQCCLYLPDWSSWLPSSIQTHHCRCACLACTLQRWAKDRVPESTVMHHAVVAFAARGSLDLQSLCFSGQWLPSKPVDIWTTITDALVGFCSDCLHDSLSPLLKAETPVSSTHVRLA